MEDRLGQVVLDGFSIYEVDGVFCGERIWEQRTLVIRLLLVRRVGKPVTLLEASIEELGKEIADHNTFLEVILPPGVDAAASIDALNTLDIVEIAEPMPAPICIALVRCFTLWSFCITAWRKRISSGSSRRN